MKVEILEKSIVRHKLTVSPCESRITIKLAAWTSDEEKEQITSFLLRAAQFVTNQNIKVTMRGRIRHSERSVVLRSDSDKISLTYSE